MVQVDKGQGTSGKEGTRDKGQGTEQLPHYLLNPRPGLMYDLLYFKNSKARRYSVITGYLFLVPCSFPVTCPLVPCPFPCPLSSCPLSLPYLSFFILTVSILVSETLIISNSKSSMMIRSFWRGIVSW